MKAKLIKDKHINDFYYLMVGINTYATTHKESFRILSLKNCQAIENGYDLYELAKADADLRYNQPGEEDLWLTRVTGIEYGFNLALEILGDKKFSEEDLSKAILLSRSMEETFDTIVKSLQQNEWQVEVITDKIPADLAPGGWDVFPKLDEQNCLILKRVEC